MITHSIGPRVWAFALVLAACNCAFAQIDIGTTNAGDGANVTISGATTWNLAEATTSTWNAPPLIPGKGVYDPTNWAVVYKFGNLTISPGATLSFLNHPTHAPVVILVQGDFVCDGAINLDGRYGGFNGSLSAPGPGGFCGGAGRINGLAASGGCGPGGGFVASGSNGGGGSFGSLGAAQPGPTYGTAAIIPLIGGSGGSGCDGNNNGGGAGGGAILIAARSNASIGPNGRISSIGGQGGAFVGDYGGCGSGGAIRIICNNLTSSPNSQIYVQGGSNNQGISGGSGRVRIERNTGNYVGMVGGAAPSVAVPGGTAQLWPLSTAPTAKVARIGSIFIGSDPQGGFGLPDAVVSSAAAQLVRVECTNVPVDGTWAVQVRVTPRFGNATNYVAALQPGGTQGFSVWTVSVPFGVGSATVIGRAYRIS